MKTLKEIQDLEVKSLLSGEAEKLIDERFERVKKLVLDKVKPALCSHYGNGCDYVQKQVEAVNLNISQASGYFDVICEMYPCACDMNQEE